MKGPWALGTGCGLEATHRGVRAGQGPAVLNCACCVCTNSDVVLGAAFVFDMRWRSVVISLQLSANSAREPGEA